MRRTKTRSPVFKVFAWLGVLLLGGLICAIAIGGLFTGWPADRTWEKVHWSVEHKTLTGHPTCDDPAWLRRIEIDRANQYYLPDPHDHPVAHTFDDDPATAWWQKWPPAAPGVSRVAWTFQDPETVKLVCLIGGWARDTNTYTTTGRPSKIKLTSAKGCDEKTLTLPDHVSPGGMVKGGAWEEFSIQFECERTKILRLWIESVYPSIGEESQQGHIAISEVAFYG
jgi:hypothetical protein